MSQPIRITESTVRPLKIVESTIRRLDPAEVAAALGGEPTGDRVPPAGPVTRYAARAELYRRQKAAYRRVSDPVWARLEQEAGDLGASPGQLADALLTMVLDAGIDRAALAARLAAAKTDPPAV
jgi:hypothetical protein